MKNGRKKETESLGNKREPLSAKKERERRIKAMMAEMITKHLIPPFSVSLEYPVRGPTKQHRNQGQ